MSTLITTIVTKRELEQIVSKVSSKAYISLSKHTDGDGHLLKSIKAVSNISGMYEIEVLLDIDPRDKLKELGLLEK